MNNRIPLYIKLRNELIKRIEEGKYKVNAFLPSERNLINEFKVGRETVRRAMSELEHLGYVRKKQGVGTFVVRQYPMDIIEPLASFTAELESRGVRAGDKLLTKKIIHNPPKQVIDTFNDNKILYTKRVRFADKVPFAVEDSYFPLDMLDCLDKYSLKGSYYQLIVHKCKIAVTRITQNILSRMSTKEEMNLLLLKRKTPMLIVTRVWFSYDKPIYYLIFSARSDLYSFKSEVKI